MTQFDLGWVIGIMEGEGCMSIIPDRNGLGHPSIKVAMTDEDVVRRLHEVTGLGTFRSVPRSVSTKPHHKDQWAWTVSAESEAMALLVVVLPHLGARRTEAAWKLVDLIGKRCDQRDIKKTQCASGHSREEFGYRTVSDALRCRACNAVASKKAYAKLKEKANV